MADKYFLRRDMQHGIVTLVGENDTQDEPYEALVSIATPHGGIAVSVTKDGHFIIQIHPKGIEMLPIVGTMGKESMVIGIIHSIGGESLHGDKGKMN